ncbi:MULTISPECIES: hypothetical protein [Amycolatopsis]|uniref:hypothetical protein n=1 Tax=Amycolatopsis TaxID=1813 RepID=UPI001E624F8A|nr:MULTISPECIES: hypothetical protein [Amycolatopsis]
MTDPRVLDQIRKLPDDVLDDFVEVYDFLELVPWSAPPYNIAKPDGPMRQLDFAEGRGCVTYLVLDDQDRVDVLDVTWLG